MVLVPVVSLRFTNRLISITPASKMHNRLLSGFGNARRFRIDGLARATAQSHEQRAKAGESNRRGLGNAIDAKQILNLAVAG